KVGCGRKAAVHGSRASESAKDAKDAKCRAELARLHPRNPQQNGTAAQQAALYRKPFRVLCVFRGQIAALDLRPHTSRPEQSITGSARLGHSLGYTRHLVPPTGARPCAAAIPPSTIASSLTSAAASCAPAAPMAR